MKKMKMTKIPAVCWPWCGRTRQMVGTSVLFRWSPAELALFIFPNSPPNLMRTGIFIVGGPITTEFRCKCSWRSRRSFRNKSSYANFTPKPIFCLSTRTSTSDPPAPTPEGLTSPCLACQELTCTRSLLRGRSRNAGHVFCKQWLK